LRFFARPAALAGLERGKKFEGRKARCEKYQFGAARAGDSLCREGRGRGVDI
jgi:hypothetical protein